MFLTIPILFTPSFATIAREYLEVLKYVETMTWNESAILFKFVISNSNLKAIHMKLIFQ